MPGVTRVNIDSAGGPIIGNLAPTVRVNNQPITVKGASITPHGISPHSNAVMVGSSSTVYANNINVCRQGDVASCGHIATGSGDVNAG